MAWRHRMTWHDACFAYIRDMRLVSKRVRASILYRVVVRRNAFVCRTIALCTDNSRNPSVYSVMWHNWFVVHCSLTAQRPRVVGVALWSIRTASDCGQNRMRWRMDVPDFSQFFITNYSWTVIVAFQIGRELFAQRTKEPSVPLPMFRVIYDGMDACVEICAI